MIEVLKEFLMFLGQRKRYWLWPFACLLLLLSIFVVAMQTTALSSFIYSLF